MKTVRIDGLTVTRRATLAGAAGFSLVGCMTGPVVDETSSPLDGEKLYADLQRYASFGPKRTGSTADHAVSAWLEAEARFSGATVETSPFRIRQFMLDEASLELPDGPVLIYPYWFPRAGEVTATVTFDRANAASRILVIDLPPGTGALRAMPRAVMDAQSAGAAALVLITHTPSGEPFAHGRAEPCAVPTLIAGGRDLTRLRTAALSGESCRFVLRGNILEQATGQNVLARIGGSGPQVVISTPTSAWTTSGGERGPGVALWLALMRRAAADPRGARWLFTAFSGHELDGAGSRAFLNSDRAPVPSDVAVWCHLGASIATRRFEAGPDGLLQPTDRPSTDASLLTNRPAWLPGLASAFAPTVFDPAVSGPDRPARGELQLYFGAGYPTFGFEGPHDFFHTPGDTAATSGPDLLEPIAIALDRFLSERLR
jgi:hypothetical protein